MEFSETDNRIFQKFFDLKKKEGIYCIEIKIMDKVFVNLK